MIKTTLPDRDDVSHLEPVDGEAKHIAEARARLKRLIEEKQEKQEKQREGK